MLSIQYGLLLGRCLSQGDHRVTVGGMGEVLGQKPHLQTSRLHQQVQWVYWFQPESGDQMKWLGLEVMDVDGALLLGREVPLSGSGI